MGPGLDQVSLCDGCWGNPQGTPGRESRRSSFPNCRASQSLGPRKGKGAEEETRMRVIFPATTDGRHWVWCRERGWRPPDRAADGSLEEASQPGPNHQYRGPSTQPPIVKTGKLRPGT